MSRTAKILIYSLVFMYSIYNHQSSFQWFSEFVEELAYKPKVPQKENETKPIRPAGLNNNKNRISETDETLESLRKIPKASNRIEELKFKTYYPLPENGYSPYDAYFGKGIYDNASNNSFIIENSENSHAVVLLVNVYNGRKVRNEFVRKGSTFEMTGVPNGTYYLEWFSGDDWSPQLQVASGIHGGFQTNPRFTKTTDRSDWMKVEGYQQWTVTLYSVVGGDVESDEIDADEFFN